MSPPIAWSGPEELETVQRHGIKLLIWIINRAMHLQSRNGNTIRISDSEMLGNRRTLNWGSTWPHSAGDKRGGCDNCGTSRQMVTAK